MNNSHFIIEQYRKKFPLETLKETALKTKIHYTRIFRLYRGSPMKLSEYHSFKEILNQEIKNQSFIKISKECHYRLSEETKKIIEEFMNLQLLKTSIQ